MNVSAKDFVRGRVYNKKFLERVKKCLQEVTSTPDNGIQCCLKVLNLTSHHKYESRHETTQKCIGSQDNDKHNNASMRIVGIRFTPLLLGKVQIVNVHIIQRDLLIKKLYLHGTFVLPKKAITKIKLLLISDEHRRVNTDSEARKHFYPKMFTTVDWVNFLEKNYSKIDDLRKHRTTDIGDEVVPDCDH